MAEHQSRLRKVDSFNLGKLGHGGVALKINLTAAPGTPQPTVELELSRELSAGLVKALTSLITDAPPTRQ